MKAFLFVLGASLGLCACGSPGLIPDPSPLAVEAGDFTGLIEISGCGYQPQVMEGYAYCRVPVGPVGSLAVTFIAPPQATRCAPHSCPGGDTSCDPTSCVDFTLFYPNQAPAYKDTIPFGQTAKTIPWSTLVKKDTFDADDTGFWLYTYTIRWTGLDGREQRTISDGEIRLRVIRPQVCQAPAHCKSYVPLRDAKDDTNFVWAWREQGQEIRMTTAARTFLEYPRGH